MLRTAEDRHLLHLQRSGAAAAREVSPHDARLPGELSTASHVTTALPLIGQGERNLAFWTRASRGELSDEDWREFIK